MSFREAASARDIPDLYEIFVFCLADAPTNRLDDTHKALARLHEHQIKNTGDVNANRSNTIGSADGSLVSGRIILMLRRHSIKIA